VSYYIVYNVFIAVHLKFRKQKIASEVLQRLNNDLDNLQRISGGLPLKWFLCEEYLPLTPASLNLVFDNQVNLLSNLPATPVVSYPLDKNRLQKSHDKYRLVTFTVATEINKVEDFDLSNIDNNLQKLLVTTPFLQLYTKQWFDFIGQPRVMSYDWLGVLDHLLKQRKDNNFKLELLVNPESLEIAKVWYNNEQLSFLDILQAYSLDQIDSQLFRWLPVKIYDLQKKRWNYH